MPRVQLSSQKSLLDGSWMFPPPNQFCHGAVQEIQSHHAFSFCGKVAAKVRILHLHEKMYHQGWDLNHEESSWQLLVQDISLFLIRIWLEVSSGTTSISMRNTGSFRKELMAQCMNKSYSKWKSRVKCSQNFSYENSEACYMQRGQVNHPPSYMETWESLQLGQRHFQGTLPHRSLSLAILFCEQHIYTHRDGGESCTLTLLKGPRLLFMKYGHKKGWRKAHMLEYKRTYQHISTCTKWNQREKDFQLNLIFYHIIWQENIIILFLVLPFFQESERFSWYS